MKALAVLVLVLGTACREELIVPSGDAGTGADAATAEDAGTDDDAAATDGAGARCADLAEQACASNTRCQAVGGTKPGSTQSEFAGCRTAMDEQGSIILCNTVFTCAHPPDKPMSCYRFGSTCTPDGWVRIQGCRAENPSCP